MRISSGGRRLDLEIDLAVVEQQVIAVAHLQCQLAVSREHAAGPAHLVANRDDQRIPLAQRDGAAAFEPSGANLGAAQVLQDRDMAVGAGRGLADLVKPLRVIGLGAVREVEAEYVHSGGDQCIQHRGCLGGGTDGRDDLGVSH